MDVHPTKNVSIGIDPYPISHHKKPPKSHALNQSIKIGEASDSPCTMPLEIFMGAEPSLTT